MKKKPELPILSTLDTQLDYIVLMADGMKSQMHELIFQIWSKSPDTIQLFAPVKHDPYSFVFGGSQDRTPIRDPVAAKRAIVTMTMDQCLDFLKGIHRVRTLNLTEGAGQ